MIYRVSRVRCGDVGSLDWQLRCLTDGGVAASPAIAPILNLSFHPLDFQQ
ncbi:hypothetical protein [Nostoc sp. 'Peltigera membranacea cyanobiont' 232]|nr:hypothetical protein [Nostoc sp. 'Peltigera membranacea cyanobiont' 232]